MNNSTDFKDLPVEDLVSKVNEDVTSGISERKVFFAPIDDVADFPETIPISDPDFTLEKARALVGDITFKAGKGWRQLHILPDSGEIKDVFGGSKGNKKVKGTLELFISNNSPRNIGYADIYRNVPCIWLVRERNKRYRVLGDDDNPAWCETGEITSGKGAEDDSGIQLMLQATTGRTAPFYSGEIHRLTPPDPPPPTTVSLKKKTA